MWKIRLVFTDNRVESFNSNNMAYLENGRVFVWNINVPDDAEKIYSVPVAQVREVTEQYYEE